LPEPTGSGFGLFVLGVIVPIPQRARTLVAIIIGDDYD